MMALPALLMSAASLPALPCAPPLEAPLSLDYRQSLWLPDGRPASVTIRRTILFRRDGPRFIVDAVLRAIHFSPPDKATGARLDAAYGPPGARAVHVRLDETLAITGVDDLDALWAAFVSRQAAVAEKLAAGGASDGRASQVVARLAAMADAQRLTVLTGFLAPILRHCGAPMPRDAQAGPAGTVLLSETVDRPGQREVARFTLDAASGLVRRLERVSTPDAQPLRPLEETWSLTPEN